MIACKAIYFGRLNKIELVLYSYTDYVSKIKLQH